MGLEKNLGGRPRLLNEEVLLKAHKYIYCEGEPAEWANRGNVIPTIEDFALYLRIARDTVYDWATKDRKFSDIVEAIRQEQASLLINKGLEGKFNSTIAKLILSGKHGYVEKSETDVTTKGEAIAQLASPELAAKFTEFLKQSTKQ